MVALDFGGVTDVCEGILTYILSFISRTDTKDKVWKMLCSCFYLCNLLYLRSVTDV